jgi:hypothetical protein
MHFSCWLSITPIQRIDRAIFDYIEDVVTHIRKGLRENRWLKLMRPNRFPCVVI